MNTIDLPDAIWRKSSLSDGQNNCIEVATLTHEGVGVRDSKNPDGPALVFSTGDWRTFVNGIKGGEFDNLKAAVLNPADTAVMLMNASNNLV
ncbi:DUF397 domain-containing protein [Streptosporangium amethystogenes]|uniref:DUF397 domain-containing protein n=1 Tax=Streptosporangium amethystogenes TaxID=2002 RepID=UPI00378BE49D